MKNYWRIEKYENQQLLLSSSITHKNMKYIYIRVEKCDTVKTCFNGNTEQKRLIFFNATSLYVNHSKHCGIHNIFIKIFLSKNHTISRVCMVKSPWEPSPMIPCYSFCPFVASL